MFKSIDPKQLNENVFSLIGDKWMLITAGTKENCNTMTASWGGLGVFWGAPTATCYIRPQRYTKEFVDREEYFTLAFFGEEYRKALALCGAKSGRDTDKIRDCGLTLCYGAGDAPFFDESEWVLVCEKLYAQDLSPEHMVVPSPIEKYYDAAHGGWHRSYIGRVVEVYHR